MSVGAAEAGHIDAAVHKRSNLRHGRHCRASGACSAGPVLWTMRHESADSGLPATLLLAPLPPPQGPVARTDCTVAGLPPRKHDLMRKSQIGRSSPVVFSNSAKLDCGHSLVHGSFSVEVHGAHGYFL